MSWYIPERCTKQLGFSLIPDVVKLKARNSHHSHMNPSQTFPPRRDQALNHMNLWGYSHPDHPAPLPSEGVPLQQLDTQSKKVHAQDSALERKIRRGLVKSAEEHRQPSRILDSLPALAIDTETGLALSVSPGPSQMSGREVRPLLPSLAPGFCLHVYYGTPRAFGGSMEDSI